MRGGPSHFRYDGYMMAGGPGHSLPVTPEPGWWTLPSLMEQVHISLILETRVRVKIHAVLGCVNNPHIARPLPCGD